MPCRAPAHAKRVWCGTALALHGGQCSSYSVFKNVVSRVLSKQLLMPPPLYVQVCTGNCAKTLDLPMYERPWVWSPYRRPLRNTKARHNSRTRLHAWPAPARRHVTGLAAANPSASCPQTTAAACSPPTHVPNHRPTHPLNQPFNLHLATTMTGCPAAPTARHHQLSAAPPCPLLHLLHAG